MASAPRAPTRPWSEPQAAIRSIVPQPDRAVRSHMYEWNRNTPRQDGTCILILLCSKTPCTNTPTRAMCKCKHFICMALAGGKDDGLRRQGRRWHVRLTHRTPGARGVVRGLGTRPHHAPLPLPPPATASPPATTPYVVSQPQCTPPLLSGYPSRSTARSSSAPSLPHLP